MDEIDKKILNILQREFPLEEQPFLIVGKRCGISEDETISHIRKMKEEESSAVSVPYLMA